MQISKLGLGKEYQLSTEGTRNRYLFREKMVYERIRVWTSGQSLPPLPPRRVRHTSIRNHGTVSTSNEGWAPALVMKQMLLCYNSNEQ